MVEKFACCDKGVNSKSLGIHYINVMNCGRAFRQTWVAGTYKQFLAIRRNVIEVFALIAEGNALTEVGSDVIAHEIGAPSPTWLPVAHFNHLINLIIFLRTFFVGSYDEIVFCRTDGISAIWHISGKATALTCFGVNLYEMLMASIPLFFYICNRTWHPSCITAEDIQQPPCLYVTQFSTPLWIATTLCILIGHYDVCAIRW